MVLFNKFWAVALSLIVLCVSACSQAPSEASKKKTESITTDPHGLHVVNNQRLREIMQKLRAMNFDEIAREIDATGKLHRDVCEVSSLATSLAADANAIPMIFREEEMSDESRRVLNVMSARLKVQALELGQAADRNDIPMIKLKLNEMISTCNDCHASFRAPLLACNTAR